MLGDRIGTATNLEVAEAIYNGIAPVLVDRGAFLASQCCEHLNRALVIEQEALEKSVDTIRDEVIEARDKRDSLRKEANEMLAEAKKRLGVPMTATA